MVSAKTIGRFLNLELSIRNYEDNSINGLQVDAKKDVKKIGFAVDGSMSTLGKAKRNKCDMVIVHHGIKWKGKKDKTGLKKSKIDWLRKNKISLYACHLPLDAHPKYGNNIQLAKLLGLEDLKRFGRYNGKSIGYKGKLDKTMSLKKLADMLKDSLKTNVGIWGFGKKKVKTVAIVSGGGGSDDLAEAMGDGIDCFITGEAKHSLFNDTRDLNANVLVAGHYATETLGVKALMPMIKKRFDVKTSFIDNPTRL